MIMHFLPYLFEIFCFYLVIKSKVLIKELYRIGFLNISLILLFITLSIYVNINKNAWVFWINGLLCFIILYKLIKLKTIINYSFSKNNKTFNYFYQQDTRWNKIKYGKSTIGKSGCGIAVLSMIHSAFDKEANPITTAKWITDNFHNSGGTSYDIMIKYFNFIGVDSGFLSREDDIKKSINNNIICVIVPSRFYYINKLFGSYSQHCLILYEISGNKAYIADPDNFSRKVMSLKRLKKRVEALPKIVTHPYIYVRI